MKKCHLQITSNTRVIITSNLPLISDTNSFGASQAGIAGIVSLSINNTISIDPLNGAQLNEPSWALLSIPPRKKERKKSLKNEDL